jgi:hypothetical protein
MTGDIIGKLRNLLKGIFRGRNLMGELSSHDMSRNFSINPLKYPHYLEISGYTYYQPQYMGFSERLPDNSARLVIILDYP